MNYQDPQVAAIYDLANPLAEDARFYIRFAGQQSCSVLDLGCGTGTLCCALAERGHGVTGVDPSGPMLTVARRKPCGGAIEWVESSAQTYRSHQRFDLIVMTGHAFQILLTDDDASAAFETMRLHLKERGRIAFETRNPRIDWVREWTTRSPRILCNGQIIEKVRITAVDGDLISFQTSYQSPDGILTTSSKLRFPSREHVETLISRSGLVVRNVFGDWDANPFEAERSPEIILVADGGEYD